MTVSEQGQIQIHTENIFPIIKKAVYSSHEVFFRELVSNAADAINKRRMAAIAGDCSEGAEGLIRVTINREVKAITISDNGIGMTAGEVKRYINQVAFSSAEEFLDKYKTESDAIIGHFGLGFYSSFMVARKVELVTLSARPDATAIRWSCDGSPTFNLVEDTRKEPGTDVILHLMEEELEYLEPSRLRALTTTYCDFMPVEIQLQGEKVNRRVAPWRRNPRELNDQDYVEFYRYLHPFQGDPLLWVHLNTDYPYSLQGIVYFPRLSGRVDWEKEGIRLYCNQVYVSDSIREIVPRYLLPLRGVIDSPDIPLNVSRSALQADRRVRSIGNFIAKKIADRLRSLKEDSSKVYAEAWHSIAPFIKIGAMEDDKFADQVTDLVLFGTTAIAETDSKDLIATDNKAYTTLEGYRQRLGNNNQRILYCTDEVSQANALSLWTAQGLEVIKAETVIDSQFIPWLESRYSELQFQRVDAELDASLRDGTPELSNQDGSTDSEVVRALMKEAIADDRVTVQVQLLKGDQAPAAMILLPEQMRRMNDISALMEQRLPGLPEHHVLLINQKHQLVNCLLRLQSGSVIVGEGSSPSKSLARDVARYLYDMARLSVGGLEPNELCGFQNRSTNLVGTLMERAL